MDLFEEMNPPTKRLPNLNKLWAKIPARTKKSSYTNQTNIFSELFAVEYFKLAKFRAIKLTKHKHIKKTGKFPLVLNKKSIKRLPKVIRREIVKMQVAGLPDFFIDKPKTHYGFFLEVKQFQNVKELEDKYSLKNCRKHPYLQNQIRTFRDLVKQGYTVIFIGTKIQFVPEYRFSTPVFFKLNNLTDLEFNEKFYRNTAHNTTKQTWLTEYC